MSFRNALVTRLKAVLSVLTVFALLFTQVNVESSKTPYNEPVEIAEDLENTEVCEVSIVENETPIVSATYEEEVVEEPIFENPYGEPQLIRATCYTWTGNRTADGSVPREGYLAGKREWLGYTAILYDMNMNCIGIFEFRDTGFGIDTDGDGIGSLQEGTSIDIYRDTLSGCYDWIAQYGDYLYIQVFPSDG